jgi:HSP20 family molecular chaperone IbpA
MSYYPGLYTGFYLPDPWQTTWVPQHYPEHHYPLEHTRHAISKALGGIAHDFTQSLASDHAMASPCSDIRESVATFYIDIELPGLAKEDQVKLKWIGPHTLLLRAVISPATTPEDGVSVEKSEDNKSEVKGEITQSDEKNGQEDAKASETAPRVYLTLKERRFGTFGRAFNFPVNVDHDNVTAKLYAGVLRLTVPKVPEGSKIDRYVNVQAGESHQGAFDGAGAVA